MTEDERVLRTKLITYLLSLTAEDWMPDYTLDEAGIIADEIIALLDEHEKGETK